MTAEFGTDAGHGGSRAVDPQWWVGVIEGQPAREVLARRDFGAVFRFLRAQGWSLTSICSATGMSETRIRAVMHGEQRITSYEVLERVSRGLSIRRGAVGLAYTDDAGDTQARP